MKHYKFIDYITQGYIALVAVIILVLHDETVPAWPWLLLAHGACMAAIHWLIQAHAARPNQRVLNFLRHFYPILLYTGFYRETGLLNQMLFSGYLDPFFVRLEEKLFGFQPSIAFMQWLPYRWASELFYAAYFSYYVMITGVGLALLLKNRQQFLHYVSVVSFTFYVCYLTYIFTPVIGPRLFYREIAGYQLPPEVIPNPIPPIPEAVQSGIFYKIMAVIYDIFESPGAAFPSSHIAVALVTLYFSFKYLRAVRHIHAVTVLLLCLSTVYGHYHYVVDVIGGAAAALVLVPAANWLWRKSGEVSSPEPS
ncbi:MAG: phosphatase PAP2 family protein, partial [Verrucomicrobiae bacterium]|nr:phosphatase PAP2 family protein [Verrucomicrobiae bacterium]